jgi:hypothetical protein
MQTAYFVLTMSLDRFPLQDITCKKLVNAQVNEIHKTPRRGLPFNKQNHVFISMILFCLCGIADAVRNGAYPAWMLFVHTRGSLPTTP